MHTAVDAGPDDAFDQRVTHELLVVEKLDDVEDVVDIRSGRRQSNTSATVGGRGHLGGGRRGGRRLGGVRRRLSGGRRGSRCLGSICGRRSGGRIGGRRLGSVCSRVGGGRFGGCRLGSVRRRLLAHERHAPFRVEALRLGVRQVLCCVNSLLGRSGGDRRGSAPVRIDVGTGLVGTRATARGRLRRGSCSLRDGLCRVFDVFGVCPHVGGVQALDAMVPDAVAAAHASADGAETAAGSSAAVAATSAAATAAIDVDEAVEDAAPVTKGAACAAPPSRADVGGMATSPTSSARRASSGLSQ